MSSLLWLIPCTCICGYSCITDVCIQILCSCYNESSYMLLLCMYMGLHFDWIFWRSVCWIHRGTTWTLSTDMSTLCILVTHNKTTIASHSGEGVGGKWCWLVHRSCLNALDNGEVLILVLHQLNFHASTTLHTYCIYIYRTMLRVLMSWCMHVVCRHTDIWNAPPVIIQWSGLICVQVGESFQRKGS